MDYEGLNQFSLGEASIFNSYYKDFCTILFSENTQTWVTTQDPSTTKSTIPFNYPPNFHQKKIVSHYHD